MVVPVLPHEVKVRWGYFTFSRTQLPVLCVYVEGAICQDNDLQCSGSRDGTGQHFCSPVHREVTRNRLARTVYVKPRIIFQPGPARGP